MTGLTHILATEIQHCLISSASLSSVQDAKASFVMSVLSFIIEHHFTTVLKNISINFQ